MKVQRQVTGIPNAVLEKFFAGPSKRKNVMRENSGGTTRLEERLKCSA
ncbi:hypothetical protein ACVWYI_000501 [Bradyrhizobium sp. LB13.1]